MRESSFDLMTPAKSHFSPISRYRPSQFGRRRSRFPQAGQTAGGSSLPLSLTTIFGFLRFITPLGYGVRDDIV
jgi:hypothetical protein